MPAAVIAVKVTVNQMTSHGGHGDIASSPYRESVLEFVILCVYIASDRCLPPLSAFDIERILLCHSQSALGHHPDEVLRLLQWKASQPRTEFGSPSHSSMEYVAGRLRLIVAAKHTMMMV